MTTQKRFHVRQLLALLALSAGLVTLGIACDSSDDNPEPTYDPTQPDDGKGGSGGDGNGGSGGSDDDGGAGGQGDDGGEDCWQTEPRVCFQCEPETNAEFLDACTDSQCVPYDNSKLSMLLPDGKVPPLP